MIGIGFRRCPKCKGYMTPYLITSGKTYYKCPSCEYDSANEFCTWTNKTNYKGGGENDKGRSNDNYR